MAKAGAAYGDRGSGRGAKSVVAASGEGRREYLPSRFERVVRRDRYGKPYRVVLDAELEGPPPDGEVCSAGSAGDGRYRDGETAMGANGLQIDLDGAVAFGYLLIVSREWGVAAADVVVGPGPVGDSHTLRGSTHPAKTSIPGRRSAG